MSDTPVSSMTQINKGNTTAYLPGDDDDTQRVDLDEYYEECEQTHVTKMVTGAEAFFSKGVLSKSLARLSGLSGCENYDPIPSRMNARLGGEGFVSVIVDGFKKFIENIIKYVKMAVNWIVDLVKTLLGYKKTKRQVEQATAEMENIKKEFKELLKGLGFPSDKWDLDKFIADPEVSFDRMGAFHILRNKFMDDAEAIKRLGESLPTFVTAVEFMNQSSKNVKRASDNFHKVIHNVAGEVRKGKTDGRAELELIKQAGHEIKLATNFEGITTKLSELYNALYTNTDGKVIKENKFSNEALQEGYMEIRAQLQQLITTSSVSIQSVPDRQTLLSSIADASARYVALKDTDIDLSHIDFKQYGDLINKQDAEIIREIDKLTGVNGALISAYSNTAKMVRDYTQFCHSIINVLNQTNKQLENLWLWHSRAQQMIFFYVLKDFEGIVELNKQYIAMGMNPYANGEGIPRVDGFIKYDDRVTMFEKIAGTANDLLEENINGIKDSIRNLSRSLGWTPR
ncbi:hypothetical protein RISINGSUN_59 [Erwinia phage vB_EamM_RisingSun]|uniref:Uncharacterized protein n=1 Tax=Erwinia phage vB_EamM_RisingSun TaxID=2026080 RepID=A0A223LHW5_9CAUD|nr:virion structural protein [Erwinia phage vB_EamM_RisingSun]ASU03611.1 hypothetical protein RISINGSUN_59 [Erwinia phage vB_EamM_RisingSun]